MKFTLWSARLGIRKCREMRGMTQARLAEKCRLKPSAISHFETGRRTPSLGNLIILADMLDVSLDQLCFRKWTPAKANQPKESL